MTENPEWAKIWEELEADFRRCRADGGHVHTLIVCELCPGTPDFDFIPEETEDAAL